MAEAVSQMGYTKHLYLCEHIYMDDPITNPWPIYKLSNLVISRTAHLQSPELWVEVNNRSTTYKLVWMYQDHRGKPISRFLPNPGFDYWSSAL